MPRYFEQVRQIWEGRSPQVAHQLATRLYPGVVVEQDVVDRTQAVLADSSLPAGLRQVLLEKEDGVGRALAARAVSA